MKDRIAKSLDTFFFAPASPLPLAVLRIGLAALLLVQAFWLAPHLFDLYGREGILQDGLNDFIRSQPIPTLGDLGRLVARLGFDDKALLLAAGITYVTSLVALLVGYYSRGAAAGAWILHLLFGSATASAYGVDSFATIALFYLTLAPCGGALSLDRFTGRVSGLPSAHARLVLRVIQLNLCIAYLASGIEKGMGPQWWTGDAIWRAMMLPMYAQFDVSWISKISWITRFACLSTLLVECGYAVAMWVKPLRRYWVLATLGLHMGIAVFMGLHLFALVMMLLTFSVFGIAAEPRAVAVGVPARARTPMRLAGSFV